MSEARASRSTFEMPSNSLFDTLNPSGSMGVGERCAPKKKAQKTSFAQTHYVATTKPSGSASASNNQVHLNASSTFQKHDANPHLITGGTPRSASEQDNLNPLLGIVVLCSIIGLVGLGGLVASNTNNSAVSNTSTYSQDGSGYGAIPYGKARFKSGRTGKTEIIGVSLSQRKNVNGHIVYDASWADGYGSSYVFWSNGKVEIFSKNGVGEIERTNARFRRMSNGDCVITADTNAVTTFPRFSPVVN